MGTLKLQDQWPELLALFFVVLGFLISVFLRTPAFSYISVLLSGFLAGRIYYLQHYKEPILPSVLVILGFLAGYVAGSFWVSRVWTIAFFAVGFAVSYYLHLKGIVAIFKSKDFIQ
mgnify:CR=1 FL=1